MGSSLCSFIVGQEPCAPDTGVACSSPPTVRLKGSISPIGGPPRQRRGCGGFSIVETARVSTICANLGWTGAQSWAGYLRFCPNVILSVPPNVILSVPPNVILSGVEGWRVDLHSRGRQMSSSTPSYDVTGQEPCAPDDRRQVPRNLTYKTDLPRMSKPVGGPQLGGCLKSRFFCRVAAGLVSAGHTWHSLVGDKPPPYAVLES